MSLGQLVSATDLDLHMLWVQVLQHGLIHLLDRIGKFIFRLPWNPRVSRAREGGEGAPVKTDEGVDAERETW